VYAVETMNLTKIYENRQIATNGINISVPQGSIFGLVGPNGAGKSTTLRLLLGLQKPTAGSVRIFGEPMNLASGELRRRIGFLPQGDHFPPDMTPITYLEFVGKLLGVPKALRKARLSALLHAVDLLGAASTRISNLSTGMTTRMAIAASLLNDPDLLLWDEPTIGLDPTGRKYAINLLQELKNQGKTMVLSTHILPDADQVCDYIGVLNQGKLVYNGSVLEMKRFIRENAMDLALDGDVAQFEEALSASGYALRWEWLNREVLRVTFEDEHGFMETLSILLEIIARIPVQLVSVRSAGEIEDAFLKQLEEDRTRGFRRAFDAAENSSLSGRPESTLGRALATPRMKRSWPKRRPVSSNGQAASERQVSPNGKSSPESETPEDGRIPSEPVDTIERSET